MGSSNSECLGLSHELVSLVLSLSLSLPFIAYLNLFRAVFFFSCEYHLFFLFFFIRNTVHIEGEDFTLLLKSALAQRTLCVPKFIELVLVVDHDLSLSCNRTAHDLPSSLLSIFYFIYFFFYFSFSCFLFASRCLYLFFVCFFFHIAVEGTDKS